MAEVKWNNVEKNELPVVDKDYDFCEIPYLGAFYDEDPSNCMEDDCDWTDDDLVLDIVYYYGNNHWKNSRWEKVYLKYWMEIPPYPSEIKD